MNRGRGRGGAWSVVRGGYGGGRGGLRGHVHGGGRGAFSLPNISYDIGQSQDPVLASIADMIEAEPGVETNQDNLIVKMGSLLDRKLTPINKKLEEMETNNEELKIQVQLLTGDLQSSADQQEVTVQELSSQVSYLKYRDNVVEQRDRDPGIRIFNYKVPENLSFVELSNKIYDDLFKDTFIQAAKDGLLPSREIVNLDERDENGEPIITTRRVVELPLHSETIEYCHTLPGARPANLPPGVQPRRATRIPVIIVKLHSRNLKEILFKYKKESLKLYNRSKNLSFGNSVFINDDLTKANLICLNDLKASDNIEDAYSLGGKIRFSLKANPLNKLTVRNPFANELSEITKFPKA